MRVIYHHVSAIVLLLLCCLVASSLEEQVLQQTLYSYTNSTLYVRLINNDFISIDFNQKFDSTNSSSISKIILSPRVESTLTIANDQLYAFYNDGNGEILVDLFNGSTWNSLEISDSFQFYNYSTYLATLDNTEKIYIYGGISLTNDSDITSRILEFDVDSHSLSDNISTSVSPTNFYGASNLLINYNTQLVIGGKALSGWVSLRQLAMWQYESWSFKSISNYDNINARKFAQMLPIFSELDSQNIIQSSGSSSLNIDGLILIGGELIQELSVPNVLKLNVTGNGEWNWSSLDDDLKLDVENILGSCVVYQTLITFTESSDKTKRDGSSQQHYTMNLYDVSDDVGSINSVDYTAAKSSKGTSSNKTIIIAVSVVVPIVVIILLCATGFFYMKYKNSKDPSMSYESFDFMDFYNNHSKKSSFAFGHDEVKVNNYDDNDNLSISSWRRKREEFERSTHHQKKKPLGELPPIPNPTWQQVTEEAQSPLRNESVIRRSLSLFSKTFSMRQKPSIRNSSRISEEEYEGSNNSRSTLQLVNEDYKTMNGNDSGSLFSAATYYEEKDSPIKKSPYVNTNRFSDMTMLSNAPNIVQDKESTDQDDDVYDDIDVQVLVSSKRRSKLRVMNPDVSNEEEVSHDVLQPAVDENLQFMDELFEMIDHVDKDVSEDGARKRVVSGESNKDV